MICPDTDCAGYTIERKIFLWTNEQHSLTCEICKKPLIEFKPTQVNLAIIVK